MTRDSTRASRAWPTLFGWRMPWKRASAIADAKPLSPAKHAAGLARDLKAGGGSATEIDAAFEAAILANPADRLLLADWMDNLLKREPPEAVAGRLAAIQASHDLPIRSILLALRDQLGLAKLRDVLADRLARIAETEAMTTVAAAWEQHLQGGRVADHICSRLLGKPNYSDVYFAILHPPVTQLSLLETRITDERALTALGVKVEKLRAFVQSLFTISNESLIARAAGFHERDPDRESVILTREQPGQYKYAIIEDRNFNVIDPFTGGALTAIDSVRFFGRTVYTFRGEQLFYLICGNMGNDALGLYLPAANVGIPLSGARSGLFSGPDLASVQSHLVTRICRSPDAFAAAFRRGSSPAPKDVILHIEKTENLAHHLWNFYSCVDHIIEAGLIGRISRVQFSGTEFFGPLEDIFPELKSIGVEHPPRVNIVDPCPFSEDAILIGAGSMFMARTLPERIIAAMRRRARGNHSVPGDYDPLPFPIVWLGMRLGDKSWVDQERELPRIIDALSERHPSALFLLDGFSFPVGKGDVRGHWAPVIKTLADIAESARRASRRPDRVINMVGNTLQESVLWAAATDVYLAPLGTTQHKVAWFTDAQGLTYASPSFRDTAHRTPGAWAAEISPTPLFVIGEGAGAGERRGLSRARERMENVRLDTAHLVDELLRMIDARARRRETR